jgi:hypothetical protein
VVKTPLALPNSPSNSAGWRRLNGTVARLGVVAFWRSITSPGQSSSATAFAFKCRQAAASRRSGSKPKSKKHSECPTVWFSGLNLSRSRMLRPPLVRRSPRHPHPGPTESSQADFVNGLVGRHRRRGPALEAGQPEHGDPYRDQGRDRGAGGPGAAGLARGGCRGGQRRERPVLRGRGRGRRSAPDRTRERGQADRRRAALTGASSGEHERRAAVAMTVHTVRHGSPAD